MLSLTHKLAGLVQLPPEDVAALEAACTGTTEVPNNVVLLREGDSPSDLLVVLKGWAARQKNLSDGGRQILGFLLPGDVVDICALALTGMDHEVEALTPITLAKVSRPRLDELLQTRPSLTRAFLLAQLVDEAVMRAWIANLGRRDAYARLGNLLCELWEKVRNAGLATGNRAHLPLTQSELADAMGLTPVHVNRVLKRLRDDGLVSLRTSTLEIPDAQALARAVDFNPSYLLIRKRH